MPKRLQRLIIEIIVKIILQIQGTPTTHKSYRIALNEIRYTQ